MQNQTMRHCTGCMTKIGDGGGHCSNPDCDWDDASQPEIQEHLPRHYVLLDRYYIGRVLGQGGFGVTYIAQDLKLNRVVAIKEYLPKDQCSRRTDRATVHSYSAEKSEEFQYGKQRFLNEAQNVAMLGGHPNVVSITDYAEANGTAYMVMEFIPGVTLKQYLAGQGGSIPYKVASELMLHVMSGLRKAHEQGLVHRDVSPDNIMISDLGPIKLIDFGAARQAIGEKSQNLTMILKPGYAPEEQYRARGVQGPWTDVYAAAATLYRCITGKVPPAAPDRLAEDELIKPSALCKGLPPVAEAAILKGLAVRSGDRFQTIRDFQQALLAKPNVPPPPPPPPPPRVGGQVPLSGVALQSAQAEGWKPNWVAFWVIVGIFAVIGIIAYAYSQTSTSGQPQSSTQSYTPTTEAPSISTGPAVTDSSPVGPPAVDMSRHEISLDGGKVVYWDPISQRQINQLEDDLLGEPRAKQLADVQVELRRTNAETTISISPTKASSDSKPPQCDNAWTTISNVIGAFGALDIGETPVRVRAIDDSGRTICEVLVVNAITGSVTDTTGASVPGATVTLTDTSDTSVAKDSSFVRSTGHFDFGGVVAGTYTLQTKKTGFKTDTRTVEVGASGNYRVDVSLQVGADE